MLTNATENLFPTNLARRPKHALISSYPAVVTKSTSLNGFLCDLYNNKSRIAPPTTYVDAPYFFRSRSNASRSRVDSLKRCHAVNPCSSMGMIFVSMYRRKGDVADEDKYGSTRVGGSRGKSCSRAFWFFFFLFTLFVRFFASSASSSAAAAACDGCTDDDDAIDRTAVVVAVAHRDDASAMGSKMRRRICSLNAARRVLKEKSKSCVTQRRVERDRFGEARLKRTTRGEYA